MIWVLPTDAAVGALEALYRRTKVEPFGALGPYSAASAPAKACMEARERPAARVRALAMVVLLVMCEFL
ncbi:hypothetical protein D3C76_1635310 [compost metagenome]